MPQIHICECRYGPYRNMIRDKIYRRIRPYSSSTTTTGVLGAVTLWLLLTKYQLITPIMHGSEKYHHYPLLSIAAHNESRPQNCHRSAMSKVIKLPDVDCPDCERYLM